MSSRFSQSSTNNSSSFKSTTTSRSYIQPSVDHRNPRQQEVWDMQSMHQSRLNYIHFMARLDGKTGKEGEDFSGDDYYNANEENDDRALLEEEETLKETLRQEKELLEKAKRDVQEEIDRCQKMLDNFRAQRKKQTQIKNQENQSRRKIYEEELEALKATIEKEKSDIRVSIHQIDYMNQPDAEDVTALNSSYNFRHKILKDQANAIELKSQLTSQTQKSSSSRSYSKK